METPWQFYNVWEEVRLLCPWEKLFQGKFSDTGIGSEALVFDWRSLVLYFWSHLSLSECHLTLSDHLMMKVKFIKPHLLEWKIKVRCCENNGLDVALHCKCPAEGKCSEKHCGSQLHFTWTKENLLLLNKKLLICSPTLYFF